MKIDKAGLADIYANLLQLEKVAVQKRALQKGLVEAAKPMAAKAAANAPVDDGDLQASMAVGTKLSDRGRKAAPPERESRYRVNAYVGATPRAPEASLVEFGTAERFQKDGTPTGRMQPQPYLRPAWESEMEPLMERLKETLAEQVAKAIKRQTNRAAKRGK